MTLPPGVPGRMNHIVRLASSTVAELLQPQFLIDSSWVPPGAVSAPKVVPLGHDDAEGCNWTVEGYDRPDSYEAVITAAIRVAMSRFNLR